MKKFFIGSIMIAAFCILTAGSVSSVTAQVTLTKKTTDLNTDLVIETKQGGTTQYQFTIEYDNGGVPTDVIIKDTIPAEWNVMVINGEIVGPVKDKDGISIIDPGDGNGTFTVVRSGKDPKGEGPKPPKASPKKNNSSTQICWIPPTDSGTYILTVTVETRQSPSGKPKWAPTSCGLLVLNPGATAFEYDPDTGEIVLDDEGLPVEVAETTAPLNLVAVEDLNGGGVVANGTGDEDGDTLSDEVEVLVWGTDPCNPDSDNDGLDDSVEVAGCTDPQKPDTDGDTLSDSDELTNGTDPCNPDSDGDGCDDNVDTAPNDDTTGCP